MAELQRDGLGVLQQYQHQLVAAGRWLLDLSLGLAGAVFEIFLGVIVAAMIHASRSQTVAAGFRHMRRVSLGRQDPNCWMPPVGPYGALRSASSERPSWRACWPGSASLSPASPAPSRWPP